MLLKSTFYRRNTQFVAAIRAREREDVAKLTQKLRQALTHDERKRIGVSHLKSSLEYIQLKEYMNRLPDTLKFLKEKAAELVRACLCLKQE